MSNTAKRPTDLQPRLLREIARYWRNHGIPPTHRELTGPGTRKSTHTIHRQIRRLQVDGFLETTPGIARSIRLTDRGWAWAGLRRPCCRATHDENGETDVDITTAREMPEVRA